MANTNLKATITAEDKGLNTLLKNLSTSVNNLGNKIGDMNAKGSQSGGSFGRMASSVAVGSGAVLALHGAMTRLVDVSKSALSQVSNFEQYRVSFETMLGSADAARAMLEQLSAFALKTPFTLPGIVDAAKQLLAFGINVNELMPDLNALGNVAAGFSGNVLPELSLAFGQVAAKGKLAGQEIIQFTNAGVPIIDELAKSLGKTRAEVIKLSESGQISFGQVRKAFMDMTSEGGRFHNLMPKLSNTMGGVASNIVDQVGRITRAIFGLSEGGDIQAGGPFERLKTAAETFLSFLTAHTGQIAAFFQAVLFMGEKVFKGIAAVVSSLGPQFFVTAGSVIMFGTALFGVATLMGSLIRVAVSLATFMGGLGSVLVLVSVLAGVVLGKALTDVMGKIKNTVAAAFDFSKIMKTDVPEGADATGKAVDKLGQQLADLDDQINKSNRDFREQLAQIVKDSQAKVKSLKQQLNQEMSDFKEAQQQQVADHADKVKNIQDQINKETQMGVLADQLKISSLRDELSKENAEYERQRSKDQANHDKKVSDLQAQLNQENQLLQKHAADVKSIQNVTLLDTIDSLKRSHHEQMIEYNKQRTRIIENADSTGTNAANSMAKAFAAANSANQKAMNKSGATLGNQIAKGIMSGITSELRSTGSELGRFFDALGKTVADLVKLKHLRQHKTVFQLFQENWDRSNVGGKAAKFGSATGGLIQAEAPRLVGEQGPEMFVPNANGRIVPNNKLGGMGGATNINITINAQAFTGSQMEARKFATMLMGAYKDAMAAKGMVA